MRNLQKEAEQITVLGDSLAADLKRTDAAGKSQTHTP
jgi:hypothetical protein